jgi:hypothetical protein
MAVEVTITEMVQNGTLSAEMAAVMWAAVDEQASFLTVAVPQFAGKTTLAHAVLDLRPDHVPLHHVAGERETMERLKQERLGGYLIVGEFSRAPVPGYIWGEPVRRVFDALGAGYALQTSLHAPGPAEAIHAIIQGNGVAEEQVSTIKLVAYIERFGSSRANLWRRVTQLYELHGVEGGKVIGQPLFRWNAATDSFEREAMPLRFGRDEQDLAARGEVIARLAQEGRTGNAAVGQAVAAYRSARPAGGSDR